MRGKLGVFIVETGGNRMVRTLYFFNNLKFVGVVIIKATILSDAWFLRWLVTLELSKPLRM